MLSKVFDLESLVADTGCFGYQNIKVGVAREDRIKWEQNGVEEFTDFFKHVCNLPHVQRLADAEHTFNLLPHSS